MYLSIYLYSLIIGFFLVGVYIPLSWKQRGRRRVEVCQSASLQTGAAVRAGTRFAARWALKALKVHPETLQAAVRSGQRGGSRLSRAGSGLALALFIPHLHSVRLSSPPLTPPPLLMPLKSQMDGGSFPLLLGYGARAEDTHGGKGGRAEWCIQEPPPLPPEVARIWISSSSTFPFFSCGVCVHHYLPEIGPEVFFFVFLEQL